MASVGPKDVLKLYRDMLKIAKKYPYPEKTLYNIREGFEMRKLTTNQNYVLEYYQDGKICI